MLRIKFFSGRVVLLIWLLIAVSSLTTGKPTQALALPQAVISLNISPNPAVVGQTVTLTATVTCVSGFATPVLDTINFNDGQGLNVTAPMSSGGVVSIGGQFSAGVHNITATFYGDPICISNFTAGVLNVIGTGGTTSVTADCPTGYPILGSVIITTSQTQPVYDKPDGDQIVDHDKKILLPNDADHNGQDEYSVLVVQTVGGKLWYGLYIGGCIPVWVPASGVTVHNPITGTSK
jgi:hypothetical protein